MMAAWEERVRAYVDRVCAEVKCRDVHEEIRLELEGHLFDLAEEFVANGYAEDEAIERALRQMGDPAEIGKGLHRTHKPRVEWGLLVMVAALIGFGVLTMYSIAGSQSAHYGSEMFVRKLTAVGIGLLAAVACFFLDVRKLQKYAWPIFGLTLAAMVFVGIFGVQVNGAGFLRIGPFTLDVASASPYLLLIGAAGLLMRIDWKKRRAVWLAGAMIVVPFLCYMIALRLSWGSLYVLAFGLMICFTSATRKQKVGLAAGAFALPASFFMMALFVGPHAAVRREAFLHPENDPFGAGYQLMQSILAIREAGWWGHGVTAKLESVPEIGTDFVFSYLVYAFGWMGGIAVCLGAMLFVGRMLKVAKRVQDAYSSLLVIGFVALFAGQFVWSILMPLGYLPVQWVSLPFVSDGGSLFLVQMIAVGLVMSAYRRKDMVGKVKEL